MNFHVHFWKVSVTTKIVRPSLGRAERFFNKGKHYSIFIGQSQVFDSSLSHNKKEPTVAPPAAPPA